MFLLEWFPDWVFYASLIASVIGLMGTVIVKKILTFEYRLCLNIILIGSFSFSLFMVGAISNEQLWKLKVKEMEVLIAQKELASNIVTNTIVTKYVDRIKLVEGKIHEVIKKVPVYITKESDAKCAIDNGFVLLHDAAASNTEISNTTRTFNAETSSIRISDVATTITQNYGSYHEVAEQLLSLQEWIRQQQRLSNGK
tara:strand:- start:246 stop:839 length:594 start_codon:yes stop_codon:yes gene_type:complete